MNHVWRARLGLFSVLLVLIGVNAAILVSYNGLYESRVRALQETQKNLEERKREVTAAIAKLKAREEELGALREKLQTFYTQTLGTRKERLAALIEELYALTRKSAMRPDEIAYSEDDTGRMSMTFLLRGKYIDVKKLMAELETSDSFFVLEGIAVAADDDDPDGLKVNVTVTHFFQTQTYKAPKGARASQKAPAKRPAASSKGRAK